MVVLGEAPHRGPATLVRTGEGEPAVHVVRSVLGAAHRADPRAVADATAALVGSLREIVAFRAGGGEPVALADLIEETAEA